jgi:hypothetical protein
MNSGPLRQAGTLGVRVEAFPLAEFGERLRQPGRVEVASGR